MPLIIRAQVYRRRKSRNESSYASNWSQAALRSQNVVSDRELQRFRDYIRRRGLQDPTATVS